MSRENDFLVDKSGQNDLANVVPEIWLKHEAAFTIEK